MLSKQFEVGHYYHVYNRGVDKRTVFEGDADYARFLHALYICNDKQIKTKNIQRILHNVQYPILHIMKNDKRSEQRAVEILCYSLMPNHFHILLKQIEDGGISFFMKRLGISYTKFFNAKYERSGVLFQGKYKAKHVNNERYLSYVSKYIHFNPLDIIEPEWKSGIKNKNNALDFLENYRWSSFMDYVGIKNFPSIINKELLGEYYKTPDEYGDFIKSFSVEDLAIVGHILD